MLTLDLEGTRVDTARHEVRLKHVVASGCLVLTLRQKELSLLLFGQGVLLDGSLVFVHDRDV